MIFQLLCVFLILGLCFTYYKTAAAETQSDIDFWKINLVAFFAMLSFVSLITGIAVVFNQFWLSILYIITI